jgi:hypothetical protein
MATLIKKTSTPATKNFTVGDRIKFRTSYFDGRTYESTVHEATVVKVNRVNLMAETAEGYLYKLAKTEAFTS